MTAETGSNSPTPPASSAGDVDLFGTTTAGRPNRRSWRVELQGLGYHPDTSPVAQAVRVTLIEGETGRRIGAVTLPFDWIRDVAAGSTTMANIREGDWS